MYVIKLRVASGVAPLLDTNIKKIIKKKEVDFYGNRKKNV